MPDENWLGRYKRFKIESDSATSEKDRFTAAQRFLDDGRPRGRTPEVGDAFIEWLHDWLAKGNDQGGAKAVNQKKGAKGKKGNVRRTVGVKTGVKGKKGAKGKKVKPAGPRNLGRSNHEGSELDYLKLCFPFPASGGSLKQKVCLANHMSDYSLCGNNFRKAIAVEKKLGASPSTTEQPAYDANEVTEAPLTNEQIRQAKLNTLRKRQYLLTNV